MSVSRWRDYYSGHNASIEWGCRSSPRTKRLNGQLEQSQTEAIDQWMHAFEEKQDENHVQERVQEVDKDVMIIETDGSMINTLQSEHVQAMQLLEGRSTTRRDSPTSELQQTRDKEQELDRYKLRLCLQRLPLRLRLYCQLFLLH